ncbi:PEP-CTERM sorting domain-containing protein [Tundrisphaera lichenicola]|uniref:PEP-CTERM sorting domain-containing protein n=1 Tax=Tundrisphaera lichenicola TaxID=2029860 RepID=UPI003EBB2D67
MNRTALIALTLGLISLCPGRSAEAEFIVNGNFEAPVITNPSYSIFKTIPGWTSTTGAGIEIQNHIAGAPIEGDQFVELDSDNNSNMFQDIATTVGQSYHLSFYYSPRPGISAASNGIKVFWGGSEVTELTGVGQASTDWSLHNFDLTATQGVTRLEFLATGTSDSLGGYLDVVSLNAVPEPSSMALCGLAGIGGLGYSWVRRKRSSIA